MPDQLAAPRTSVEVEDTGLNDIESSDESSDQFTDASEGQGRPPSQSSNQSRPKSPIPITRVERVDDEPAHGEVPGTVAYSKRTQDAVPDQVEIVSRSRSASRVEPPSPSTPIPTIVAMKIDPDVPGYGDVPGTDAYEQRKADAQPDVILKSPETTEPPPNPWSSGSPTASQNRFPAINRHSTRDSQSGVPKDRQVAEEGEDDGFGDDFDDFEQEQEDIDQDDDFGAFGEFTTGDAPQERLVRPPMEPIVASIPSLDWSEIDGMEDLQSALEPYLHALYPSVGVDEDSTAPSPPPQTFLSDRSLSLYQQLIAPPPLAPPNWLRSRIRRLFFVSLGVPVDLDEILPASKQKKLILPSIHDTGASTRDSTSISREESDATATSVAPNHASKVSADTNGIEGQRASSQPGSRRRTGREREREREPAFNAPEARRLGSTTEAKLLGLDDAELKAHVDQLEEWLVQSREALRYWQKQKEGAQKEKEAFEGVIENLVKHARKVRK